MQRIFQANNFIVRENRNLILALVTVGLVSGVVTESEAAPRWTVSADGTEVSDSKTGLIWKRGAGPNVYTYTQALAYAAQTATAENKKWRLPNIKEITSISAVEPGTTKSISGTINGVDADAAQGYYFDQNVNFLYLPGDTDSSGNPIYTLQNNSSTFWSSTPDAGTSTKAWAITAGSGIVSPVGISKGLAARLVRDSGSVTGTTPTTTTGTTSSTATGSTSSTTTGTTSSTATGSTSSTTTGSTPTTTTGTTSSTTTGSTPTATTGTASTTTTASSGTTAPNLALNAVVTASSLESSATPAKYVTDGITTTRWASASSDPQWIYVDLGSKQTIGKVVLNWEAAYAVSYSIDVSDNASTWTSVYSTTSSKGGVENISVSTSGRYVRVYGTKRATQWGYSLYELGVYSK